MKRLVILAAIITALVATGVWYYSDEKVVVRKSHEFLDSFKKDDGDGLLSNVMNEEGFRDLLDKQVALDFQHRDMPDMKGGMKQDRSKLANNYLYLMKSAKYIKLTEKNVELINVDDKSAQVKTTLHGEVKHSQSTMDSDITLLLDFKKSEEGWRISGITVSGSK